MKLPSIFWSVACQARELVARIANRQMRSMAGRNLREFFRTLDLLKVAGFLCVAFAVATIIPAQSLELYRYAAQSMADAYASNFRTLQSVADGAILILSVSLLSAVFWAQAAFSYALHSRNNRRRAAAPPSLAAFSLIAALPCLAVSFGMLRATIDTHSGPLKAAMLEGAKISFAKDEPLPGVVAAVSEFAVNAQLQVNYWLYAGCILLFLLAASFGVASYLSFKRVGALFDLSPRGGSRLIVAGVASPVCLSLVFVLFPVSVARTVSAFGVICLFFATLALVLAAFRLMESRLRIPLLLLVIIAAIAFSFLGLNDNHGIRQLASAPAPGAKPPPQSIGDGFVQWLLHRKDLERYETYPVYLIAAEGGGIYAAFRTATFLTSLQDQCPRFSHHLFAISSVSGGSIGAAIFRALAQKIKLGDERFAAGAGCRKNGDNAGGLFFTDVAEDVLRDDFLSPVLAAFLFPDLLQRFLFFPIPQFDRSIALEKSFESSWDERLPLFYSRFPQSWADHSNPLRDSFNTRWDMDSDIPALFINTTEVGSGRGRVIAPFDIDTEELSSLPLFGNVGSTQQNTVNISLSTAAVLSARFPWLTPPGLFRLAITGANLPIASGGPAQQPIQLVDGGYLDNSGVVTALNVVREIEATLREQNLSRKVRLNLIVLTSASFAPPSGVPSDYLTPVEALLSTRGARGLIAIKQAENFFKENRQGQSSNSLGKAVLQGYGYPLPLGWRLSPITRLLILGQNGDSTRCAPTEEGANCLKAEMYQELNK